MYLNKLAIKRENFPIKQWASWGQEPILSVFAHPAARRAGAQ